jgi:hypothetical protein
MTRPVARLSVHTVEGKQIEFLVEQHSGECTVFLPESSTVVTGQS